MLINSVSSTVLKEIHPGEPVEYTITDHLGGAV